MTTAACFSMLAAVGFLLGTGSAVRVSFVEVLWLYALGGGVAGALAGALRPHLARRAVAVTLGAVAMVPVAVSYRWLTGGAVSAVALATFLVPAALFGAFVGLMLHGSLTASRP